MTDIGPPTRGARPRYRDTPLTAAERGRMYRARKAGKAVPSLENPSRLRDAYHRYLAAPVGNDAAELKAFLDTADDIFGGNTNAR